MPVGSETIAETEFGVVFHLLFVIKVNAGKTLNAAAPDGMANRIFYQLMERPEVTPPLVDPMDARIRLILGMVQTDDTILPCTDPKSSTTIHQLRLYRIALTQLGISHKLTASRVQTEEAAFPSSNIDITFLIFGKRPHTSRHIDICEFVGFSIIARHTIRRSYPNRSIR